jgi:hypothetical protein
MKIAYADPPYIGQAHRYPEKQEVDHQKLILELEAYDGWALSCHSPSLRIILPMCPSHIRVGAWVKPFSPFKPMVNPAYAWEPVIYKPARVKHPKSEMTVRDWISISPSLESNTKLLGAKPYDFCFWIFRILGARGNEDTLDDLFPGTGIVGQAWQNFKMSDSFNRFVISETTTTKLF